jgi:predicted nucleotidyltransferase
MITRMGRSEVIARLQQHASVIKAMGATSLFIFGSTIRDEARPARDLDLFIDYDPNGKFNAFDLVGIKQYLEDELKMVVDVTTRDGLHPLLKTEIEQTAVRVF